MSESIKLSEYFAKAQDSVRNAALPPSIGSTW